MQIMWIGGVVRIAIVYKLVPIGPTFGFIINGNMVWFYPERGVSKKIKF